MKPTDDDLRAVAIQALWRALGRDPSKTTEPVAFPDGVKSYLEVAAWLPDSPVAQDVGEVDLNELALETQYAWSVSHRDRGAEYVEALDLGDDYLYEAYTLTEIEHGTLRRAIPKARADEALRAMGPELCGAQLLTDGFDWQPASVYVRGLDENRPEAIRAVVHALSRKDFAHYVVETMYERPWRASDDDGGEEDECLAGNTERLAELWKAAVTCKPPCDGLPPGFEDLVGRSREFGQWLDQTAVRWSDTGTRLDAKEAEAVRMTCLFLAVAE